jgi:hypothetical protein
MEAEPDAEVHPADWVYFAGGGVYRELVYAGGGDTGVDWGGDDDFVGAGGTAGRGGCGACSLNGLCDAAI